ncbi:ABC-2 type transport system ATP-binding protein [Peptostreptococcaceae bacterium pGA-8]|nr:ABC-2 type transport system ATP-binding protein [Peptostreptococcaceae bacterium pGA-8]
MNSIRIKELRKNYDKFSVDIDDLTIPSGCIVGIIGINGSGKTSLLKILSGITKFDFGYVELFGTKLDGLQIRELQKIASVFEDINFPGNMTIRQVEKYCSMTFIEWDNDKFDLLLAEFRIERNIKIISLSKGMRSKLLLSIALSHNPNLLLLDETLSGLDPIAKDVVLKKLSAFIENENNTVIISSNNVNDFQNKVDYILLISQGKVRFFESCERLLENFMICDYDELISVCGYKNSLQGVRSNAFSKEALVDVNKLEGYKNLSMRPATIEEILIFMEEQ